MNVETEDNSKDIFYVEPQFCIFVLGAGFTRAFAARAPLLVDDYDTDGLFESFKNFPFASQVMELESRLQGNGKINIERLLTRLQDGMPYDAHHGAEEELQLLLSYIKRQFSSRIERIRETGDYDRELIGRFAEFCVNQRCSCISFNYDDLLDEALWAVKSARGNDTSYPYWHPDGGYGFFCKPSETIVEHLPTYCDDAETLLLKLHGSINWRLRLGAGNASGIDSIVHHETWLPPAGGSPYELIERHLEREPLIIPPILNKIETKRVPILREVWTQAFEKLTTALQVIFIGYSFPVTDTYTHFLFNEAFAGDGGSKDIIVVDYKQDEQSRQELIRNYKQVFPSIQKEDFFFDGAELWLGKMLERFASPVGSIDN